MDAKEFMRHAREGYAARKTALHESGLDSRAMLVSFAYANRNYRTAAGREDEFVPDSDAGARGCARATPNQAHVGIARVPDARVAKLAELFKPKKITYATIEYVDIGGLQKDREKNSASLVPLREADALAHVVRLFENPAVPHEGGSLDAMRDIENVELELILDRSRAGVEANRARSKKI